MAYTSDLTSGGLERKQAEARKGEAGSKTGQKLIIAGEAQALETGSYGLSQEELEAKMGGATRQIGATTQATMQAMGPLGVGGKASGKMMEDIQNLNKGVAEQVSSERMSTQQLEREITEKKISDAKARIIQAEQMRQENNTALVSSVLSGGISAIFGG